MLKFFYTIDKKEFIMKKEVFDFYDRTILKSYNLDKTMQYQLNILGSLDMFTRQHSENVARRIVDFISGGVYALDGYIQKVSNSIFLVAPSNYEITNEMAREEMKNKLSVSWLKNNNLN